ncbi:leucine-rich repeat receptor-like protein kinase TDR [Pyrus ussuriensis x Pyrus communis]|uniref:Leucine-rich repeat receptor-like protein kinase TDR n=1 Tax=Pyrus ussuriensis x Pyrus communis TaxID=2448454 RepID=A0A5N5I5C6_9ROSA|nr:leucine-rich repeat receptor-like protein kinase TDR [Pyrus ussuriensis x Pyrus communis]
MKLFENIINLKSWPFAQISGGTSPLRLFSKKVSGVDPEIRLSERSKFWRALMLLSSAGINPERWFLKRKMDSRLLRSSRDFGMAPERFA